MKIKKQITQRGFEKIDFKDKYGIASSIQVSSNIEPSLWIGVNENRMILDKKDCLRIALCLIKFYIFGKLF